MTDGATTTDPDGTVRAGAETGSATGRTPGEQHGAADESVVDRTTVDVLLAVWGGLYALYALHLLFSLTQRVVDPTLSEALFGALFALALAAGLFAAATDRLPAAGYVLLGVIEVRASLGLARGGFGISFRAGAADAAASGLLLANLAIATVLLARGVRRIRAGEPLVPSSLRERSASDVDQQT